MSRFFSRNLLPFARGSGRLRTSMQDHQQIARGSTSEARACIAYELAAKLSVLPLEIEQVGGRRRLKCLTSEPLSLEQVAELRFASDLEIEQVLVSGELSQAILVAYLGDDRTLSANLDQALSALPYVSVASDAAPASSEGTQFLQRLLEYAVARSASDLTITPRREGGLIKMRVNGELYSQGTTPLPLPLHQQIVARIKVLSGLDTTQRNRPQDGRLTIHIADKQINMRVGILPTLHGESIAIRVLSGSVLRKMSELGLNSVTRVHLEGALNKRSGIIIFSGPTGSGKTTTMYASILELLQKNLRVVTVEDPAEIEVPEIIQCSVNEKQGATYPVLLRSVLRHDPDALLIGEVRDRESAEVAYQAAHTGHLILTTTHARNAIDVFVRLSQLGVSAANIADSTLLIVSQRLLPRLCTFCRVIDLTASQAIGITAYKPVGCERCDYSGSLGRVLVSESLLSEPELQEKMRRVGVAPSAIEAGLDNRNYRSLYLSLQDAVREGAISFDQMMNFVEGDPAA